MSYEVAFKPTPYLFDEELAFSHYIVELVIRVSAKSINQYPALDKRVATTIADIVDDYFRRRTETIALYICDSSDGKQAARKRKFDDWFRYFNQIEFLKHDSPVTDNRDGVTYYNTIIIKADNPNSTEVINAFGDLFSRYNDPK